MGATFAYNGKQLLKGGEEGVVPSKVSPHFNVLRG